MRYVELPKYPGGEIRSHGPYTGEAFREDFLEPLQPTTVDLSTSAGMPGGFMNHAFGKLSDKYGFEMVLKNITFVSPGKKHRIPEAIWYVVGRVTQYYSNVENAWTWAAEARGVLFVLHMETSETEPAWFTKGRERLHDTVVLIEES